MRIKNSSGKAVFSTGVLVLALILWAASGWSATRTLKDMAGRTVTLRGPVKSVVTTFKPATLLLFSLGQQEKIVGIDSSAKHDRLFSALLPEVKALPGVGTKSTGINFETVAALAPDLVILYAQKDGLELAERLAVMRIPSIVILPESFASVKTSLELMAQALEVDERAVAVNQAIDGMLTLVAARIAGLAQNQRKTGYFVGSRGLFSTATGNMLQDDIFTRAGVINVAHDLRGYFQDISPEQFVAWNPDLIVLSQHLHQNVVERLADPALQQVRAVVHKTVYRFPCDLAPWDFPSPLSALGTLWLAHKSYPELFRDLDFEGEIDNFHLKLFGKKLSEMHGHLNDQVY
ncbi:MAG: ABC transporter substrate-binding protein [Deltaproteobacteria bacterium]|nr:ABC transporter substrate-binding protein [Deltaproteobacteria bacterium]